MLVDCEPYGAFSSQMFFDDMSFGIRGGCRIYGKRVTRFHDRYINFSRNPSNNMIAGTASVLWQTCFPKDQGLIIDAHDSPVLKALHKQMANKRVLGVMVRWDVYRTVYYDDPNLSNGSPSSTIAGKHLQKQLNGGGFQPNPARCLVVGTLGLWRSGDPVHEAGDRAILSTGSNSIPLGTAFARTTNKSITLDLSNCIPDASRKPEKVNLGSLSLTAIGPNIGDKATQIAKIPFKQYNQAAYLATSGIVEIAISKEKAKILANKNLQLSGSDGTIYLKEAPLRAIPNDPNLYMNQGETVETSVQVYQRGKLAGANINVTLAEIGNTKALALTQRTNANGAVQFSITGVQGSVTGYALLPGDKPQLPVVNLNTQRQTYMYVRVLPSDDHLAALAPTWKNVLNHVLGNWQAMAPCMDNWLDLGDKDQVKAYAAIIKKLTNLKNFEDFRYMPVTRDMTQGQRTLLYNFLDGKSSKGFVAKLATKKVALANKGHDFTAQSKAMRNPTLSDGSD